MPSNSVITIQSIVLKERSHFGFDTITLTAANIDAQKTLVDNLVTALDAIVRGVVRQQVIKFQDTLLDAALPASQDARRELKMLVRFTGAIAGKKASVEVATPDLSALTLETGDANFVVLADAGVMAAFVTAFEAVVRFPDSPTETVTIDTAQIVGRNI